MTSLSRLALMIAMSIGGSSALAKPSPATDPALPDESLHLGLGVGAGGSTTIANFVSPNGEQNVTYGASGSLRLRLPQGLTIEPMITLSTATGLTWQENEGTDRQVKSQLEAGIGIRPVLARRGRVELSALAGLGYTGTFLAYEEHTEGEDAETSGGTTTGAAEGAETVPAEQTPDLKTRYHGGHLQLGLGLTRWFDPTLSLGVDLSLAGGVGALQSAELEVDPRPASAFDLSLELDPTARLFLHLWL